MEDLFLGQTFLEGQAYGDNNCTDEAYKYRQGLLVGELQLGALISLPHVVSSIGAAWDSLVDLGSIMDQGALKTMLAKTPAWMFHFRSSRRVDTGPVSAHFLGPVLFLPRHDVVDLQHFR
ncbi:hypothetical protein GN958_ATG19875 [Phytophthora infestans]|uniref:Uncharacterized protein n=1 Tax=Phytophthora infestans TaxID=4787 RepID=A0A8S9TQV5_PHYIN|nr:hypothetical protein GN958_ATG19875 [Phytophthora infestans]